MDTMFLKRQLATQSNAALPNAHSPLVWQMHRHALLLFYAGAPNCNVHSSVQWLQGVDGPKRVDFLNHHGLAAWWAERLADESALHNIPNDVSEKIGRAHV